MYDYPYARWRWKVENVYRGGDARIKQGDDYAMRVYVMFKDNPAQASFLNKIRNRVAKLVYDEYKRSGFHNK